MRTARAIDVQALSTIHLMLKRMGLTRKKSHAGLLNKTGRM